METQVNNTLDTLAIEKSIWDMGYNNIAGVDEAGRGPLAGPVVAAAVVLEREEDIPGVTDSKKLTAKRREALFIEIFSKAQFVAIAASSSRRIDRYGILPSTMRAMTQAVLRLDVEPDYVLIDGSVCPPDLKIDNISIVKGDLLSRSIGAASIVAKVMRDRLMQNLHPLYPNYGFQSNKGYGTKTHISAIETFGPTPHHRFSFAPIRQMKLAL